MKDSIIHFKENLPEKTLLRAFAEAEAADFCLVLGSSCTVSPACLVPKEVKKRGGRLAIVNLQKTPLDGKADCRLFGDIDQVMQMLLEELARGESEGGLGQMIVPQRFADSQVHMAA